MSPSPSILAVSALALSSVAAAQLSASAPLPGDGGFDVAAGQQERPAVARGDGHFLAAWEEGKSWLAQFVANPDGLFPNRDVYAAVLDDDGRPLQSAPIVVDQSAWNQDQVRVAWNGTHYLVVWRTRRLTSGWYTDGIAAARVAPTGEVLDVPAIVIEDADDVDESFPVVASDGVGWVVAWTDQSPQGNPRIEGAYVDASGAVVQKKVVVTASNPLPTNYELAFDLDRFALVYERLYSGGIGVSMFDSQLASVGAAVDLGSGVKPAIASNGAGFYVTWLQSGARGTPLAHDGTIGVPGGALLSGSLTLGDPRVAAAWDGGRWVATFTGYGEIHASQIDTAGAVIAGPVPILTNAGYLTDPVAANGPGYALALWTDWMHASAFNTDPFDVQGATIAPGPVVSPVFPVSISEPTQTEPVIAGDATTGYLVAFASRTSGVTRIVGQRLDPAGTPIDADPIELHTGPANLSGLEVAWNGSEWLVGWHELLLVNPPQYLYHSYVRRVRADGSLPDAGAIDLLRGEHPSIAAVGGDFIVISHYHFPPDQSNEIYHFKRVRGADGAVLDATEVPLDYGSGGLDVVGFDDRWLAVWGGATGAFISATGAVGTPFYAASMGNGHGSSAYLSLARSGDVALLAWTYNGSLPWNGDLRARRILKDGTLLDLDSGVFVSSAPNAQFHSDVAWFGNEFLVTYTDFRDHVPLEPGLGDVFGARVSIDAEVLDAPDFAVQDRFPDYEGRARLVGGGGKAMIASDVLDREHGTWRVHLQVLDSGALGTSYCGPAEPNSSGAPAEIRAEGSAEVVVNDFHLVASSLPQNRFGYFLVSGTQGFVSHPGGSQGNLCLAGTIGRFKNQIQNSGSGGTFQIQADLTALPFSPPRAVLPGETWNFQAWYRDVNPTQTSNFTDGASVTFE